MAGLSRGIVRRYVLLVILDYSVTHAALTGILDQSVLSSVFREDEGKSIARVRVTKLAGW